MKTGSYSWMLAPLAALYGLALTIRHWAYDHGLLHVATLPVPTICVGNLAVGGTGKTPHVEYLVRLLSQRFQVAVLSRGYGRRTRGFVLADEQSTYELIGDEPMQIHSHFPDITLAVCEDRVRGVKQLLRRFPALDVVILDDAMQFRRMNYGLTVLLTEYNHLYVNDHLLPFGRLRDLKKRSQRANLVVVTKCPTDMKPIDCRVVDNHLRLSAFQHLCFSHIEYDSLPRTGNPLVVTGIERPEPLMQYVRQSCPEAGHLSYPDHHNYQPSDIEQIVGHAAAYDYVLTTEKDWARLRETTLPQQLGSRLCVLPIRVSVENDFDQIITRYVAEYQRKHKK